MINAGSVDHLALPGLKLPKAQAGKQVKGIDMLAEYRKNLNNDPLYNISKNDNILARPAFVKDYEQREAYNKQQKERALKELQQREFNNRSYISQDRSTPASREADRERFLEAKRQEAMANSDLAQTFGSFTPSGYNPGAGAVAANQFVKTMPIIATGSLAASEVLPYIGTALNTPIAGVAGLTGNNIMNAGFAYEAAKNIPQVGKSIRTAYKNPTLGNVGNATAETALTALNALPFAAEASRGVSPIINEIKNAYTLTGPQRNLKDLQYTKSVYGPLGYQIPENLERIAQSDKLTDRTIRGLVDRDNTVYRGVNVDLEGLRQRLLNKSKIFNKFNKNPQDDPLTKFDALILELKKANVDITNDSEVAKYMATHIPGDTGAGRANLDEDVFKKGLNGLYTSNSEGTAEGYTYGKGFIVKAKKPTDFSSSNRKKWIDKNNPQVQTGSDYKLPFLSSKPITWKTDYEIATPQFINNYREKLGREKLLAEYPEIGTLHNYSWERKSLHPEYQKILNREDQLKQLAEDELEIAAEPYRDKLFNIKDRRDRRVMKYQMNNTPMYKRALKNLTNPSFIRDLIMEDHYSDKVNALQRKNAEDWMKATLTPYLEKYPELLNEVPEVNPYAHYIHIGKPGQKVLEPISIKEITPDIWKRTSRGHQGEYSRQATRREFGGMYDPQYQMGGQPCYECGGKYAEGGYYDCPDQEKDPVTGKCKAEEVRSKEQAAANKAASADLNAWAKQVAAMDKENARQDAAQYAGQLGFDYDWMQSPVDKSEKKAAIAGYKQFFQQNPNTFVPDDTSGFSPEQKYIIASKLKQKAMTNLGAKAFQQKFNQDPRFFDLDRLQKDIVPMMGGWNATRNWMFNNKAYGGPIVDPMGQWAHPGSVTRIPGSDITMNGVDYPVLAKANNGMNMMMYPGQQYNFPGADYVDEYPMMRNGGYVVTRSHDRKGKTHKVTGPDGTVKYFGDSHLGQHPKDPERKAAFYARHKHNLEGNPFFRAYARATWKDGGTIPQYQFAGAVSSTDSLRHQAAKMMDFEARKGSPTGTGLSDWGYHKSQMPYNMQSPNWKQPTTKDEAVNMYMQEIAPKLQHFPSAMEKGEAGDFLYNTGRDPRVYMLDQYLKSKGQSGIPNRSAYNVDTKTPDWTPQLQQSLNDEWKRNQDDIYKLPVNDRRVLLNKGRDFYYQNINKKADGTPNDSYKATWKPRIWESVNTYKNGGQTDDDREMLSGVADMLRRVKDSDNRKEIAKYMMDNFRDEDVTFEPSKFLQSANAFAQGGEMYMQKGGTNLFQNNKTAYVDSVLNANKDLNWVKRLYDKHPQTIQIPGQPYTSTHFMGDDGNGYVFPTVVEQNGKLIYLGDSAENYARRTNTGIQFPAQQGSWFANNGYKKGTNVLNGYDKGGEMIRRADGHYSHRGLWDNIRANKGSGKKPTKEMLEQEHKIRKAQYGINMLPYTMPVVQSISNWWNKQSTEEEKKQAIIKAQQHAPYEDKEGLGMNLFEVFDPTGISSWDDWRRVHNDPTTDWWDELVADVSVIPLFGKLGMGAKGATKGAKMLKGLTAAEKAIQAEKALAEAAQVAKLAKEASIGSKIGKGVTATADVLSGSRPMRWIDRTLNPAAQGMRALTNPIATRLPNYVMKPVQFANDFNASSRFLNGVGLGADYFANKYYGNNTTPTMPTGPYAIDPNKRVDSVAYNNNDGIPKGELIKLVDERGRVIETHTNDPRLINLVNTGAVDTIPNTGWDQKNNAWKLKKGTKY
jgi:hypothetical protein